MRPSIRLLATSIALTVSLLIAGYVAGQTPPALVSPVAIDEIALFSDGGSVRIVLKDKNGKRFLVGLKGSLTVPRSEFPVYVERWYPWIPVPVTLSPRSAEERALLETLTQWHKDMPADSDEVAVLASVQTILIQRNGPAATVKP